VRWIGHIALALATLIVGPLVLAVALARPAWRAGLRERLWPSRIGGEAARLARGGATGTEAAPIWVHVASVGEAAAARPLIEALAEGHGPLLLTAQTVGGRARLKADHREASPRLVPLDHPWLTRLAMRRTRPRALVLVETELWPSLVAAAHRQGTPVVVVSGRISERAFRVEHELDPFFARTCSKLAVVGARSIEDAERFVALGVPPTRVRVTGDLKWSKPQPRSPAAPELASWMARRPTIALGSTHPDEETDLLAAIHAVREGGRDVQWLWAPRHPRDAAALLNGLERAGLHAVRRTDLEPERPETAEVVVLDTLGELAATWPHAMLAVVGGTFGETGGHDLLEPVHAGRPVLFGPSTHGVAGTARALLEAGAGLQVDGGERLGLEITRLLEASTERADRVARGTRLLDAGRAALDANVRLVDEAVGGHWRITAGAEGDALASTEAPHGLYARSGPEASSWAHAALRLASAFYGTAARIDRRTARLGLRPSKRLPCAVVSVGSFVAGGSGKTPVAIHLAGALRDRGHRVVVVTRGHGVRLGRRVEIASHGAGACASADTVGDEAVVIARALEGVPVLAARDRAHAGLVAVAEFGCDVLVLDDGFSHRGLHRDVDLVCLDAKIGLGNGRVLPAGPLSEAPSAWRHADALVVTDGSLGDLDERTIESHASSLRRFAGGRGARGWRRPGSDELLGVERLKGRRVGLLAGLADPAGFRALVEAHGVVVTRACLRPDHHPWRRDEIERLGGRSRVWITTAKDAVKIDPAWWPLGAEVFVLEIEWEPERGPSLVRYVEKQCGLGAAVSPLQVDAQTMSRAPATASAVRALGAA